MYFLTAFGLTPGGSNTLHTYTQTIHRTTQLTTLVRRLSGIRSRSGRTNWEECGPCHVFASYTLAFALQLRKKHEQTSLRVAEECQLTRWKQNIQNRAYITIGIHLYNIFGVLLEIWTWASRSVSQAVLSARLWPSARGNWNGHSKSWRGNVTVACIDSREVGWADRVLPD
jgi:hypothetical protein